MENVKMSSMLSKKQQRQQAMLEECKQAVINSTLGAFGLNMGMFTDRDGGNVTTLHNFERADDKYVHDRDRASYEQANSEYHRKDYELSQAEWREKRQRAIERQGGVDAYTGEKYQDENKIDADHVVTVKSVHDNKKNHLAFNTGTEEGRKRLAEMVNDDSNIVMTDSSINRSKGAKSNTEYIESLSDEKAKELDVDKERMQQVEKQAQEKMNEEVEQRLFKKQKNELLETGIDQAKSMGLKQIIGILITRLASITMTELKFLLKNKVNFGVELIGQLKDRMFLHLKELCQDIPDILFSGVKGGISGFVSNLITFLINNFLSTAKKFVTIIREGLLGIYKSFKMVLFQPQNMSKEEVWRNAIKIFSTTVISAIIVGFGESINVFMQSIAPMLKPIADVVSSALTGILAGVCSALAVYAIDSLFDKLLDNYDEKSVELLLNDVQQRELFANQLIEHFNVKEELIYAYQESYYKNAEIKQNYNSIENNLLSAKDNQDNALKSAKLMALSMKQNNDILESKIQDMKNNEDFSDALNFLLKGK